MDNMIADGAELVREIARESGASAITVFLFDPEAEAQRVRYLFNLGLPVEANRLYQQSIYRHDPFLAAGCRETPRRGEGMLMLDQWQLEADVVGEGEGSYWEFMQSTGYCEAAASIRELASGIFLVMGLMRRGLPAGAGSFSVQPVRGAVETLFGKMSTSVQRAALREFRRQTGDYPQMAGPGTAPALTCREQDIAAALCRGLSNKQIAAALRLSEFTIENYLRRIYRKHGVHNRTSLMAALGRSTGPRTAAVTAMSA